MNALLKQLTNVTPPRKILILGVLLLSACGGGSSSTNSAPTNLVATPTGGAVGTAGDQVTVTWDAVAGASGYTVYRSTQSMAASNNNDPANLVGIYSATSTAATGTTHTTPTLDGKTYYFFVTSTVGTVESVTNTSQASAVPFATVTSTDTNRVWMSRHLGATKDCESSSTDTACHGDLYQWGRAADGHQRIDRSIQGNCFDASNASVTCASLSITARATSITDTAPGVNFINNTVFPNDWTANGIDADGALRSAAWADGGVNDICPAGFSVPTIAELRADTLDATPPVTNAASAFTSFLKLSLSGTRIGNLNLGGSPEVRMASRSQSPSSLLATLVFFNAASSAVNNISRSFGISVRCIKVIAPVLANASAVTATNNTALANNITFTNTGGAPATCTVNPDLPTGLTVEGSTCTISGTPTATQTATTHTVTGTNSKGSDTAMVSLTVN